MVHRRGSGSVARYDLDQDCRPDRRHYCRLCRDDPRHYADQQGIAMTAGMPPDAENAAEFQSDPAAEAFYSGAERRALHFLLTLAVAGTVILWATYGGSLAAGFALGA